MPLDQDASPLAQTVMELRALPCVAPGQPITDATAWTGADFPTPRAWVHAIDDTGLAEIDRALHGLKQRDLHPSAIRPEHFPLPSLSATLAEAYRELEAGPGFAVVSNFPVDAYCHDDCVLAYAGLASYFGAIHRQSRADEFIVDVMDKGRGYGAKARGHYSNAHLHYHNDGTNVVSLLCLRTAVEGGESLLVSGPALYNRILAEHPHLLPALLRGFKHHRREERRDPEAPITPWRSPVFGFYGGRFHIAYTRPSVSYCAEEGVTFTDLELEALDTLDGLIEAPGMALSMDLQRGDIQFVNNYLLLHSRTGYSDTPERKRHLVRLWLDDANSLRNGPGKVDWYMPESSRFLATRGNLLEGWRDREPTIHPPV